MWKRRQEHPYTAHIAPAGGQALREGEDYYRCQDDYFNMSYRLNIDKQIFIILSSDYEYDSDEEEDFDQLPPGGVNETLSKKKYCQSFKLFHQIFDSVKQFEGFQRSVSKMKKYVFGIIFALFLEALPSETRWRMPQELWEKVDPTLLLRVVMCLIHVSGVEVHSELVFSISRLSASSHGHQLLQSRPSLLFLASPQS